jgi:type VI secretion system protein ImpE
MTLKGSELYSAGQLSEAIDTMSEEVKSNPTDQSRRGFLAELLCIAGDLERADKQLDVLSKQDPKAAIGLGIFRQLVRAEQARQQFYSEGRVPEFIVPPDDQVRHYLEASVLLRENDIGRALERLREAEEKRQPLAGTCNGEPFDDLRDLDDLTACIFEVLTNNGKYFWVPMRSVTSIEFEPPERPLDVLWRRAHLMVNDGPDGEVFFPAIYAGAGDALSDQSRLGRSTDWVGGDGAPVRGQGQRTFLVGSDDRSIMELESLEIVHPA